MTGWTAFERRTRDQIFCALLPARVDQPGYDPAQVLDFWPQLHRCAPPLLRWGLRAAVWVVWLKALSRGRRLSTLPAAQRAQLLARLEGSRLYPLRQVALVLKVVLCFAHFQRPDVRARAHR